MDLKIYARHASQDIFEKKKKRKKESHPFRSGDLEGKVLLQNTTCIGGDFETNLKSLTLTINSPLFIFAVIFVNFLALGIYWILTHWGNVRRRRKANQLQNKVARECSLTFFQNVGLHRANLGGQKSKIKQHKSEGLRIACNGVPNDVM